MTRTGMCLERENLSTSVHPPFRVLAAVMRRGIAGVCVRRVNHPATLSTGPTVDDSKSCEGEKVTSHRVTGSEVDSNPVRHTVPEPPGRRVGVWGLCLNRG